MEHEKYDGQDDGEYHFSDDQLNYDMEPEVVNASPTASGGATAASVAQFKKPLIGLAIFFALIFLVYKILAPSSAGTPAAEIAAGTKNISPAPVKAPVASTEPAVATPAPAPEPEPVVASAPEATTNAAPAAPVSAPTPTAAPVDNMAASSAAPSTPVSAPAPAVVIQNEPMPVAASSVDATRFASMEDQHAKMQAENTKKLAELESQSSAVQGKLQDLNMRLASIESTLTHLAQGMQDLKNNSNRQANVASSMAPSSPVPGVATLNVAPTPVVPATKPAPPKMIYVVQAIIPGRAWLKSEAGDTVTVAEGDSLKDFGRITKIDPYDGIVEVDVGGKLVSLSYGSGGE